MKHLAKQAGNGHAPLPFPPWKGPAHFPERWTWDECNSPQIDQTGTQAENCYELARTAALELRRMAIHPQL